MNQINNFIETFQNKYQMIEGVDTFFELNLLETQKNKNLENLHDRAMNFVEEYKKHFAGSNALYGYLYHTYIEFVALVNNMDVMDLYSQINKN